MEILEGFQASRSIRRACSPPLRSTSVPLIVPLTEASAQLEDSAYPRPVNCYSG